VVPVRVPGVVPSGWAAFTGVVIGAIFAVGIAWPRPAHAPACDPPPLRVATFNIEEFPKNAAQVEAAFDQIAVLDADAIAVQEIMDPGAFAAAANRRLGPTWHFVHANTMPPGSRFRVEVGVLYDGDRYSLVSETLHDDTRLDDGRQKPVLEVRLRPRAGGAVVQLFVLHLKAGADGRAIRHRQLDALADLLSSAAHPGERTIVLGDFNATEPADRDDLAQLAARTDLSWVTESLPCSAFWDRDDGCATSRLDHVLAWHPATSTAAAGACADGCDLRDRCPRYADEVSDHCPVIASW
jgi:endonuclease/exonuclease/phosphatase family metal-dependent hydrolase